MAETGLVLRIQNRYAESALRRKREGLERKGVRVGPSEESPEWIVYTHLLRLCEANKYTRTPSLASHVNLDK